jgi:fructosamine-3-kinase
MWHFISERISDITGELFVCEHVHKAQGGDSHASYVMRDHKHRYFVKTRQYDDTQQLHHEAEGLANLAQTNTILTPKVICHGMTKGESPTMEYLVLQHIHFVDGTAADYCKLGEHLGALHKVNAYTSYGWSHDNYIGLSIQSNGRSADWSSFFAECRIGSMLERLADNGVFLTDIDKFVHTTEQALQLHQPHPALLHGDLWHGNIGFCKKGPIVFDPAVYVGDRETDIAMAELFGGFPPSFFEGYTSLLPLDDEYPRRKLIYQLYHILNHALLFGAHYEAQAKDMIARVQSQ